MPAGRLRRFWRAALAAPVLLAILVRAALAVPAESTGEGFAGGEPDRLSRHAGTYDYNAVLYDPAVSRALYARLGGRDKRLLIDNFQVIRPIVRSGDYLILQGHATAAAGTEAAILAVGRRQGAIDAALLHAGTVALFTAEPRLGAVPPPILATAERWTTRAHAALSVRHGAWNAANSGFCSPESEK